MAGVKVRHPFSAPMTLLSLVGLVPLVALATLALGRPLAGVLVGSAVFLTWRLIVVPWTLLSAHRRGVRDVRARRIDWALEAFRDSESLFRAYPWLDRFRWFFLASGLPISYGTLARYNQVYCLAELGRRAEAKTLFEVVAREAPTLPDLPELRRYVDATEERPGTEWGV